MKKTLLLIDSHALIHRAFHALPPLTTPDNHPIGAVYGLARILIKTLREKKPDYVVAAFDRPEETHRKKEYPEYKAHREKAPDELISQFALARKLFSVAKIPIIDFPGYEADDIIGTLTKLSKTNDVFITILTGDMDSLQLVRDDCVVVETPQKGVSETKIFNEAAVFEKLGVYPNRVVDYKGLIGDTSDNIPGVPGIGPKTALKLLGEFNSIEDIFSSMKPDHPLAKKILPHKDVALLSKKLSIIHTDIPINNNIDDFIYKPIEKNQDIIHLFKEFGFKNMFPQTSEGSDKKIKYQTFYPTPIKSHTDIPKEWKDDDWFVAFSWKEIIKECIAQKKIFPSNIFDLTILFWLLNPDKPIKTYDELVAQTLKQDSFEYSNKELLEIFNILIKKIESENFFSVYTTYEMPLIAPLAKMEHCGIVIDKDVLKQLGEKLNSQIIKLQKKIFDVAGKEFNIASPKQVGEFLNSLGIFSKTKKTKTGQIKTDKETLENFIDIHPVIADILSFREHSKLLSGFVEPLITHGEDAVIHTTFLQTGTGTGRLSSQKPNMQNIPQESDWSLHIRNTFVSRKNFEFVSFDFSQLELRLLAHTSHDKTLIQAFKDGADIHTITAAKIFKKNIELVTKQERRIGKTLNFGVVYGMGPRAFAKTSGLSPEDASRFMSDYFAFFPNIQLWQNEVKTIAKTKGYVENIHHRKRWFPVERFNEQERAIINMPLQSFGADIMKLSIIAVSKLIEVRGWANDASLILTIHDELLVEIKRDMIDIIVPEIKKIMEGIEIISVPLIVGVKSGSSWGSLAQYE